MTAKVTGFGEGRSRTELIGWEKPLLGEIPKVVRDEKGQTIMLLGQIDKYFFTLLAPLQSCRSRARRPTGQAEVLRSLHL